MDSEILNTSNLFSQMPPYHLFCNQRNHKKNAIKYICLESKCSKNPFLCDQCILSSEHSCSDIEEFSMQNLSQNIKEIIAKLEPYPINQNISDLLQKKEVKTLTNTIFIQIEGFFKTLQQNIVQKLEIQKKQMIQNIQNEINETQNFKVQPLQDQINLYFSNEKIQNFLDNYFTDKQVSACKSNSNNQNQNNQNQNQNQNTNNILPFQPQSQINFSDIENSVSTLNNINNYDFESIQNNPNNVIQKSNNSNNNNNNNSCFSENNQFYINQSAQDFMRDLKSFVEEQNNELKKLDFAENFKKINQLDSILSSNQKVMQKLRSNKILANLQKQCQTFFDLKKSGVELLLPLKTKQIIQKGDQNEGQNNNQTCQIVDQNQTNEQIYQSPQSPQLIQCLNKEAKNLSYIYSNHFERADNIQFTLRVRSGNNLNEKYLDTLTLGLIQHKQGGGNWIDLIQDQSKKQFKKKGMELNKLWKLSGGRLDLRININVQKNIFQIQDMDRKCIIQNDAQFEDGEKWVFFIGEKGLQGSINLE